VLCSTIHAIIFQLAAATNDIENGNMIEIAMLIPKNIPNHII
jgi:hypothetical protein